MRLTKPIIQPVVQLMIIIVAASASLMAGCVGPLPELGPFATTEEAFPPSFFQSISADVPASFSQKASFEAPYEDVWRAVTAGVTQAQLNIESSQKSKGQVLATRFLPPATKYFFAVLVKERGSKTTDVQVVAKIQNNRFKESLIPGWHKDYDVDSKQRLESVIIFTRNNLIAAGAL